MRQWMVPVRNVCDRHLLAEHSEGHGIVGMIRKGYPLGVQGLARHGKVEVHNLLKRHDVVVAEMVRRGMNHQSPNGLDVDDAVMVYLTEYAWGYVDTQATQRELIARCGMCRQRFVAVTSGNDPGTRDDSTRVNYMIIPRTLRDSLTDVEVKQLHDAELERMERDGRSPGSGTAIDLD